MKPMIIVNGMATAGKDTFVDLLGKYTRIYKYSSIDKVKEIARACGWDGRKTEESRAFLSELKMLTTKHLDMSYKDVINKYHDFVDNPAYDVMTVFIREPEDIERIRLACNAITVLVVNDRVPIITSNYGDAHVFEYGYDYSIKNNGTLEELEEAARKFYEDVLSIR